MPIRPHHPARLDNKVIEATYHGGTTTTDDDEDQVRAIYRMAGLRPSTIERVLAHDIP